MPILKFNAQSTNVISKITPDIGLGNISGASLFSGFGERDNMGTPAAGEDLWKGSADIVPTPPDAGEQMSLVSSDANDTSAGTGVQTVIVDYLDADGDPQTETITMNGTTPVHTVATNIRFVQKIYAATVGSNGVAVGNIDIYQFGDNTTIYNMIEAGGNMSLTVHRMVPRAKQLIVTSWYATESRARRVSFRLRATSEDGTLRAGVFLFKGATFLNGTLTELPTGFVVPALGIIKISAWPDTSGAHGSGGWHGVLFDA